MDPISDMLSSIKNAQAVFHETVDVYFSNIKYQIATILEKEGFVKKAEKQGRGSKKRIRILLKYDAKIPAILGIKRISKPGQRVYFPAKKIKKLRGGYKTTIISTPHGVITNKEAKKKGVGGEVICEVW